MLEGFVILVGCVVRLDEVIAIKASRVFPDTETVVHLRNGTTLSIDQPLSSVIKDFQYPV